jgi:hypothetical protein
MSNVDTDTDGIGDACDPEPAIANPKPYWNGFYDAPESAWRARTGAVSDWEVVRRDDGTIGWRQKVLDGTRRQILISGTRQESWVQTAIAVDGIDTSQQPAMRAAGVSYGFEALTFFDGYFGCGVRQNNQSNASEVLVALVHDEANTGDAQTIAWGGTLVGTTVAVTARGDRTGSTTPGQGGSMLSCVGFDGMKRENPMVSTSARPDGQVGLHTIGMTALFDYIFIVEPRPR